jgi:uncharacterized protein
MIHVARQARPPAGRRDEGRMHAHPRPATPRLGLASLAAAMAVAGTLALTSAPAGVGAPRALYVTQAKGFQHPVLPESERIMRELGARHGFEVTIARAAEVAITAAALGRLDVVVFYTTGELPLSDEQKAALLAFVGSGKGFIGLHSAADTFYGWPAYGEMLGGHFHGHPWTQDDDVGIRVDDRTHPVTRHLPPTFRLTEEIYQITGFRPERSKLLVSLDTATTDMTKPGIVNVRFPLVWWHPYGKGKVLYNAFGHRPDVWRSERYQTMLANAILWIVGTLR